MRGPSLSLKNPPSLPPFAHLAVDSEVPKFAQGQGALHQVFGFVQCTRRSLADGGIFCWAPNVQPVEKGKSQQGNLTQSTWITWKLKIPPKGKGETSTQTTNFGVPAVGFPLVFGSLTIDPQIPTIHRCPTCSVRPDTRLAPGVVKVSASLRDAESS